LLGKPSVVAGLLLLVVALLFWGSHNQWVASLSFVVATFFFVVGWVAGTEQLVDTSLPGKIGALMISLAVPSLMISTVCSWYSEVGGVVRETELVQRLHIDGSTKYLEMVPMDKLLCFKPHSWLSSPLGTFGVVLLFFGLLLKLSCGYIGFSRLKGHRLGHRKRFAITLTLLLVGIGFLLFDRVWCGYTCAYAEFMTREFDVPPSSASRTTHGHSIHTEEFEEFLTFVDFVFKPWLNCRLESCISVPSANNITLSVFAEDASKPIINITSSEIRHSQNLQPNIPYTFRIRNTVNQSFSVVMSTKLDTSLCKSATLIGVTLILACSATVVVLTGKELKVWNQKSKQTHQRNKRTLN